MFIGMEKKLWKNEVIKIKNLKGGTDYEKIKQKNQKFSIKFGVSIKFIRIMWM